MEKYQADLPANQLMKDFDTGEGLVSAARDDLSFLGAAPVALGDEDLQRFLAQGYLVLQPTTPAAIHRRIFDKIDAVAGPDSARLNPGNNVLPLAPELRYVFDDPVVRGALSSLLGDDYMMHPHRALHDNPPGSGEQAWHHDTYWGYKRKVRDHRPWWVLMLYMPQATTMEMGPTGVLPGSQYLMQRLAAATDYQVGNVGDAGVCMLVHFDTWHRKLENLSKATRFMTKFEFVRMTAPTDGAVERPWLAPQNTAVYDLSPVWRSCWEWLSGHGLSPEASEGDEVARLAADLATGDDAARAAAAARLGVIGAAALAAADALGQALHDRHEPVALNASYALAGLGTVGIGHLDAAMGADDGDNTADPRLYFDEGQEADLGYLVRNGAYGLIAAGDRAAPVLLGHLRDGGELARKHAAYGLGQIDGGEMVTQALAASARKDPHTDVRISAVEALGVRPASAPGVDALVVALDDADDEVRFNAALSLARLGPAASTAVPALARGLTDPNRYVRGYAVEALERIGSRDALAALVPMLKDSRWCPMTTPASTF